MLKNAIRRCLEKIDEKYEASSKASISIAIPPISRILNATNITTAALIDYLMGKPDSKIRDVVLISQELETIRQWEIDLINVSINKGLIVNASMNEAGKSALNANLNQIFFSANHNQGDNIEKRIRKIIDEGYVSEKVPYFGISSEQIKQLELEFDAVICEDGDSLIIGALEENVFQLKNKLFDVDLISFDDFDVV
jgi:hypothetical protein